MTELRIGLDLSHQWPWLLPYLVVTAGALLVLLVDSFVRSLRKDHLSMLTLLTLLGALLAQHAAPAQPPADGLMGGMLAAGPFVRFLHDLLLMIGMPTVVFATGLYDRDGRYRPEFYPLLLLAILGMMVLVAATDLLSLYLGIETMSLSVYLLAAGNRGSLRSSEAGFKYLILGAFASVILLLGSALLYGQAGGTGYAALGAAVGAGGSRGFLLAAGVGLVLVAFGFKVAMVPFHMWTPDVYDGAPAYTTGLMATGVKAAAVAALVRFVWLLAPVVADIWFPLLAVLAVATMTYGNLVALSQTGLKRMLAYSSIAHAGYLLLGVLALLAPARGGGAAIMQEEIGMAAGSALLFYLVSYALMNLGAFGIVVHLSRSRTDEADQSDGYAGLARRQPLVAAALAVFMFSLAGIPPTAGFIGKFYIFDAVVKAGLLPLAIWGVVNSLLSVYYYLRIVVLMYMREPEEEPWRGQGWETAFTAGVLAVLVLVLGVLPGALHSVAAWAFRSLMF